MALLVGEEKDPLAPYRGRQFSNCAGCEWLTADGEPKKRMCEGCVATEAARQERFPDREESY